MSETNGQTPSYDMFVRNHRAGRPAVWWMFLEGLAPGEPVKVPMFANAKPQWAQQSVVRAARRLGIPVTTRTFGGELWVCRLKPEDARK